MADGLAAIMTAYNASYRHQLASADASGAPGAQGDGQDGPRRSRRIQQAQARAAKIGAGKGMQLVGNKRARTSTGDGCSHVPSSSNKGASSSDVPANNAGGARSAVAEAIAEANYHNALVRLLSTPAVYESLGMPGPPDSVEHSTLADQWRSVRIVG